MNTMIKCIGQNGNPVCIARDKIVSIHQCFHTAEENWPQTIIEVIVGDHVEERVVDGDLDSIRELYEAHGSSAAEYKNWEKSDAWKRYGTHFCVEVTGAPIFAANGLNHYRWSIHAYIYPSHPYLVKFDKPRNNKCDQTAVTEMPMPGGASFVRWHFSPDGEAKSVCVGADYTHHCTNPEKCFLFDKETVFLYADTLFAWLEERAK